jgi:serine/threonine-protein kinase RsbT
VLTSVLSSSAPISREHDARVCSPIPTVGNPQQVLTAGDRWTKVPPAISIEVSTSAAVIEPKPADDGSLPIRGNFDVVACRQRVAQLALQLDFSVIGRTMLVTAASELARNTLIHGGGGTFSWQVIGVGTRPGLRLIFEDRGPGIPDLQLALTNGWSSGTGLGLGLPGAKRLVQEFEVQSTPGRGTRVVVARWR